MIERMIELELAGYRAIRTDLTSQIYQNLQRIFGERIFNHWSLWITYIILRSERQRFGLMMTSREFAGLIREFAPGFLDHQICSASRRPAEEFCLEDILPNPDARSISLLQASHLIAHLVLSPSLESVKDGKTISTFLDGQLIIGIDERTKVNPRNLLEVYIVFNARLGMAEIADRLTAVLQFLNNLIKGAPVPLSILNEEVRRYERRLSKLSWKHLQDREATPNPKRELVCV